MKFIHLSDVRLGSHPEAGHSWDETRAREKEQNLRDILDEAKKDGIKLIMISGGLFANPPVDSDLRRVGDIFAIYPDIKVVIIASESEGLSLSSPVRSFIWPQNVHFVLDSNVQRVVLSDINTEVYAASLLDGKTASYGEFINKALEHEGAEGIRLGMMRIGLKNRSDKDANIDMDTDIDLLSRSFEGSGFSYVAVGGPNKYREITKDLVYASGFLEPEDWRDTGIHGIIRGEIPLSSGRLESVSFEERSSSSYVRLNIRINSKATYTELIESVQKELKRRGANNIYSLKLSGLRNPDEKLDLDKLKERFRILKITDTSEPDYDYAGLFKAHPQDMIGFFITRVSKRKDQMSATEKRAMFYGIDALISTSQEGDR